MEQSKLLEILDSYNRFWATGAGAVLLTQGISQTFKIQPNTNYQIARVTVDGASVGAVSSYTFTKVMASHTITASFVKNS